MNAPTKAITVIGLGVLIASATQPKPAPPVVVETPVVVEAAQPKGGEQSPLPSEAQIERAVSEAVAELTAGPQSIAEAAGMAAEAGLPLLIVVDARRVETKPLAAFGLVALHLHPDAWKPEGLERAAVFYPSVQPDGDWFRFAPATFLDPDNLIPSLRKVKR